MSRDRYWNERENYDGWFYVSQTEIEDECNISRKVQTRIVSDLVNDGVLDVVRHGVPCRNFYKIDYDRVADILADNNVQEGTTSCDEKEQQDATLGHIQLLPEGATRSDIRAQLYNKNNNKNKTKITNNTDVRKVFDHWQTTMNKPKAQFTADRKRLIEKRLKDGYTIDDLMQAIDGCKKDPHCQGRNDTGTVYDALETAIGSARKIDMYMGRATQTPKTGWASKGMQTYSENLIKRQEEQKNGISRGTGFVSVSQSELGDGNMQSGYR